MNAFRVWLWVGVTAGGLTCFGQAPDWGQAGRDLRSRLWESNTPIATLVQRVTTRPVSDGQAAMFNLSVFLHAGMEQEAVGAVQELKRVFPELDSYQAHTLYYEACDQAEAWGVARTVLELFADQVTDLTLENRLLKHWLDAGWTLEQIDAWFAARPAGVDSFWVKERLRFAQSQGRGEALLQGWADRVRTNPTATNAVVFLDALLYARQGGGPPDLSWLPNVVKPERALEAQALGERLQRLENWAPAVSCYRLAITIPLTEREVEERNRMRQVSIPEGQFRAQFAAGTREAMARCLLELGQTDAAQAMLVEAADIREQHGLSRNAFLAGTVQAASGQRTIERRIVEAESKSEDDPEYWRERAQYFRGRQEPVREEEALKQGLSLTKPELPPEHRGKGHQNPRSILLSDYAQFLARHGREGEAVALLRQELAEAPALAESSSRAAHWLAFDFGASVGSEDAVLWDWLANRPVWESTEQRLLWRMLESAAKPTWPASPSVSPSRQGRIPEKVPDPQLAQALQRAESLAGTRNPSRTHTLGWIMNRLGFPQRSIPLLRTAVETAEDEESKQRATFTLFESFLDAGHWHAAEAVFPEAARQLGLRELPQWHSRLALLAAAAGGQADALRLWLRTANASPTTLRGLEQLAALGLRDDLIAFYRTMQKELPASHAPARALELLEVN